LLFLEEEKVTSRRGVFSIYLSIQAGLTPCSGFDEGTMAITAATSDPSRLLTLIREAIAARRIQTWHLVQDVYITHSPPQFANQAFFKPVVQYGALVFQIVTPEGGKVSVEIYAVYHGRLIEMLLAHLDKDFTQVYASAMPITGDVVD
jgi:hypothetical protein